MSEDIFEQYIQSNLMCKMYKELIQQHQKRQKRKRNTKHSKYKTGRGPEQTSCPREYTDGQRTCIKMLNIINHQGNAN